VDFSEMGRTVWALLLARRDNGFLSCEKPQRLAEICRSLGPIELKHLFERWVPKLPWPLSREDRQAGYHHELALWQLECSRTDVFERPVCGRQFFEAVIRENIDLGRPSRLESNASVRIACFHPQPSSG
jgi:hypothetical protein